MLVIKHARIFPSAGGVIPQGDILIDRGRLCQIGGEVVPAPGDRVLRADGMTVMPGIIDAHTHAGCRESLTGTEHDANEISGPLHPELDVLYSVDPEAPAFEEARRCGVTTVSVLPGSATAIGGMCCVMKTRRAVSAEAMCIRRHSAVKGSLGSGPRSLFGKRGMAPVTVMGQVQLLRDAFLRAAVYDAQRGRVSQDAGLENLCRVLHHEIPLRVHVEAQNLLHVLALADEFDIPVILEHAFGFYHFLDEIGACRNLAGVVAGPTFYPSTPGIAQETSVAQAMELVERGVCTAIMTDYFPETNFGVLMLQAGEIARHGYPVADILKMLTIYPAQLLGVADRVGSLEAGKDADLVIFSATPLEDAGATVQYTILDGEIVYQKGQTEFCQK